MSSVMWLNSWLVLADDFWLKEGWADTKEGFLPHGRSLVDKAAKLLVDKRTAIDCGAHYGFVSFWLQKHFQNIHSFEIVPLVADCLRRNMNLYNCSKVNVYKCGLGDKEEIVDLMKVWCPEATSLSAFIKPQGPIQDYWRPHITAIKTTTKTIDSFNFKDVDLIKIDVEGYEQKVVRGALNTIDNYGPLIVFEERREAVENHKFSNQLYSYTRYGENQTVIDILKPLGYKIVSEDVADHGFKKDIFAMRRE